MFLLTLDESGLHRQILFGQARAGTSPSCPLGGSTLRGVDQGPGACPLLLFDEGIDERFLFGVEAGFERAIDVVAKSPPQHKKSKATRRKTARKRKSVKRTGS